MAASSLAPCLHVGDGCPDRPHTHTHRTGGCNVVDVANGIADHRCPRVYRTLGNRKTVNCPCPCHEGIIPRKPYLVGDMGAGRLAGDLLPVPSRTL